MSRDRDQLEQDRADLLAALEEATHVPIRADDLIAAASGTTVQAHPDATWDARLRTGLSDLRYLDRHGVLVLQDGPARGYHHVDWPDSDLARRRDQHDDHADIARMMSQWELTE